MRCDSVLDTIGHTPLVRLRRLPAVGSATIYVKLEGRNPTGSTKVRAALSMVRRAERSGRLPAGGTLVESSSGNMAVALAMVGAACGYRVITVVDPTTISTNFAMLRAYGAEIDVVDQADELGGYQTARLRRARHIAASTPGAVLTYQYGNPGNPEAHHLGTGPEIIAALGAAPTCLVTAVSSAGQVTGIGRAFRDAGATTQICAADVRGSAIFGAPWARHLVRGVGLAWTPPNLDTSVVDEAYLVDDELAFATATVLARHEGVLAGGSSGLALAVALRKGVELGPRATVVAVLADRGDKYLDQFFDPSWCAQHGLRSAAWTEPFVREQAAMLRPHAQPSGHGKPDQGVA